MIAKCQSSHPQTSAGARKHSSSIAAGLIAAGVAEPDNELSSDTIHDVSFPVAQIGRLTAALQVRRLVGVKWKTLAMMKLWNGVRCLPRTGWSQELWQRRSWRTVTDCATLLDSSVPTRWDSGAEFLTRTGLTCMEEGGSAFPVCEVGAMAIVFLRLMFELRCQHP